jgi:4-amino-4-deoxy-L-arabinose transferase-like glycosyltransferase
VGRTILTNAATSTPSRAVSLPPCRALAGWVAAAFVARFLCAPALPVLDDEAYYWVWSRHLNWGYLDHPPAVAALLAVATATLGDHPMALRAPSLALSAATAAVVYALARDLYGVPAARRAVLIFHAVPVLLLGGVLVSPDAPLVFFWTLAVWAAWRALRDPRMWWLVGCAVGLGLQSKYAMAFLLPGLVALVVLRPELRRSVHPYGAALLALLLFAPNLVWNAHHNWSGFRFVLERPAWVASGPIGNLALSAAGLGVYLSPVLAVLLVWAAVRPRTEPDRFLALLALPTLAVLVAGAWMGKFKPHYAAPLAALLLPAVGAWTDPRGARWRQVGLWTAAVQSGLVVVLVAASLWDGRLLADQKGWERVAIRVRGLASGADLVVAVTYQDGAQIAYATRGHLSVVVLPGVHAFEQWAPASRFRGKDALLVHDARTPPEIPYDWICRRAHRLAPLTVQAKGQPVRTFEFVRCLGFRGRWEDFPRRAL